MTFKVSYVAFETRTDPALTVAGKLVTPRLGDDGPEPGVTPAVVICHGSDGVDGRGEPGAARPRGPARSRKPCRTPSPPSDSWPPSRKSMRTASVSWGFPGAGW